MNKLKIAGIAMVAGAVTVVSMAVMASAATLPLAVTCSGAVSAASATGTTVLWTASPVNGNPPYTLLWSGDASVANSTSASITATYTVNGTVNAMIHATDASSTVATSTCSLAVTSIVTPIATSTLNVAILVNNTAGGTATPSNFAVAIGGANANPNSFAGNASGTAVMVNAGSNYSVTVTPVANYTGSASGNCGGPIAAGASDICSITETYVVPVSTPPVPTSTPPLPRVNPPQLTIGPNGSFLARGMTVTSVASGSFTGTVWGITYTVNWSGNLAGTPYPDFYYRFGNGGNATTSPSEQVAVGDEVGVSGKITVANPMVVTAGVVRDYSIAMPRPPKRPFLAPPGQGSQSEDNGNQGGPQIFGGHGELKAEVSSSASVDFGGKLTDLLNQLQNLQNIFKGLHK